MGLTMKKNRELTWTMDICREVITALPNRCYSRHCKISQLTAYLLSTNRFIWIQVNSALHPSRVAKSSTNFGWGKGGKVTSAGWQVTLCDLIWHVICRSGVVISITNCYIRFTLVCHNPCIWVTDRQTDGQMDRRTDRQNSHCYTASASALHAVR